MKKVQAKKQKKASKKETKKKPAKKVAAPKKALEVREKLQLVNLKVKGKDRKMLVALAKKFANGNLSAWLRYAGLHYKPAKTVAIY